ncbi:MAG: type I-C CRISPR-associated protein Cas5c [Rikenellaceae bacterium]
MKSTFLLEVSGAFACFTRPEFKVERLSYEMITSSAARAIFEAIYWQPQIRWKIQEIAILNPISFAHIKRCETAVVAHSGKVEVYAERCRQLRSSVILRDVKYRIVAELIAYDGKQAKHDAMFRRRAIKGQCFTQPYLGCREFAAHWRLIDQGEELQQPIDLTRDLGRMLYDIDFSDLNHPKPIFFNAKLIKGVLNINLT